MSFTKKYNNFISNNFLFNSNLFENTMLNKYNEENENTTNYKKSEETKNQERLDYLETIFSPLFISIVKSEDFEFGQKSLSIKLVEDELKINKLATQSWLNSIYIKSFGGDDTLLIGILRVIEYLNEDLIHPFGITVALASLSHANNEVKELGVRIFENNCNYSNYSTLKQVKVETVWLQEYINRVIEDFKVELCLS